MLHHDGSTGESSVCAPVYAALKENTGVVYTNIFYVFTSYNQVLFEKKKQQARKQKKSDNILCTYKSINEDLKKEREA